MYLPEVRAPMFPLQLAVELFSLEPGHLPHGLPAVTFSAKVDTHSGAVLDMRVRPSRIGTITKLTYEAADALIAPAPTPTQEATASPADTAARLRDLSDLTDALRARRRAAGAVSFTLPKARPSKGKKKRVVFCAGGLTLCGPPSAAQAGGRGGGRDGGGQPGKGELASTSDGGGADDPRWTHCRDRRQRRTCVGRDDGTRARMGGERTGWGSSGSAQGVQRTGAERMGLSGLVLG